MASGPWCSGSDGQRLITLYRLVPVLVGLFELAWFGTRDSQALALSARTQVSFCWSFGLESVGSNYGGDGGGGVLFAHFFSE